MEQSKTWLQGALKVKRSSGKLVLADANRWSTVTTCGDTASIPSTYTTGGVDKDLVIFVHASNATGCAGGQTLAYASHCRQDPQTDRPIAGSIQMCPVFAKKATKWDGTAKSDYDRDEDFHTALHEILHIMGFSDALWPFFRDDAGQPVTPRCGANYLSLPPAVAAAGVKSGGAATSTYAASDFCCTIIHGNGEPPARCLYESMGWSYQTSDKIIATKPKTSALGTTGTARTLLKTPRLLARAREHFGCPTLEGVDVEDDGGSGTAGSHWDRRKTMNEFMGPSPSGNRNVKSEFTLALLEDSGWYKADYTKAEPMLWGYKKGCAFTNGCVNPTSPDTKGRAGGYCTSGSTVAQCSFDRTGIGKCWNDGTYMDGCGVAVSERMCSDFKGTLGSVKSVSGVSALGFVAGNCSGTDCNGGKYAAIRNDGTAAAPIFKETLDVACFESSLYSGTTTTNSKAGCYEYRCTPGTGSNKGLDIKDPAGQWKTCTTGGQQFNITGYTGTLNCPNDWQLLCTPPTVKTQVTFTPYPTTTSTTPAPTTTPTPSFDCKEDKTCVVCGSGDTDSQCVHCSSSDTYLCNSKDCKFVGGSCVPGNGLMTATVPKDSKFFLTLSVTLPYTKDQFDKSKQDKYKTAVANAAGTIAANVEIVKITDARRRAGKVNVETKILAADQLGLNSLRYTLASCHDDGTAKCKIDKALAREGLEKSTAAAEPLKFTSTGGVQTPVWALSLLATTAAMMISLTTTYTHLFV